MSDWQPQIQCLVVNGMQMTSNEARSLQCGQLLYYFGHGFSKCGRTMKRVHSIISTAADFVIESPWVYVCPAHGNINLSC